MMISNRWRHEYKPLEQTPTAIKWNIQNKIKQQEYESIAEIICKELEITNQSWID